MTEINIPYLRKSNRRGLLRNQEEQELNQDRRVIEETNEASDALRSERCLSDLSPERMKDADLKALTGYLGNYAATVESDQERSSIWMIQNYLASKRALFAEDVVLVKHALIVLQKRLLDTLEMLPRMGQDVKTELEGHYLLKIAEIGNLLRIL